ncbi:amino acid ABC transporter permease [Virgibacillus byunsanensis]|uniref:Amino acid ABC transporter permease n=1 Tax=Virgibacillus byunsanensis TaxID=570945 RepID=A0ABW3LRC5_9BACI
MDTPNTLHTIIQLLEVAYINLIILVVSAVFGLLLGALLTMFKIKKIPVLKQLVGTFSSFARSVPIIIQLFIVYYALPPIAAQFGIDINNLGASVAATFALTMYHGGYLTEVFRAAYISVEKGQHEAADSFGYPPVKKFFRIILPQVIPVALPGWGNALVHLTHDTSLVFALGVIDLMGRADLISASSYGVNQVQIYIIVALLYCLITFMTDWMVRLFEKKNRKYKLDTGLKAGGI